jgi:tRNA(Glu) U13 pseudouridine synthase TruD
LQDLQRKREKDDLLLEFSLPTGSYATVFLSFILEGVDRATLKDNRLEIPLLPK